MWFYPSKSVQPQLPVCFSDFYFSNLRSCIHFVNISQLSFVHRYSLNTHRNLVSLNLSFWWNNNCTRVLYTHWKGLNLLGKEAWCVLVPGYGFTECNPVLIVSHSIFERKILNPIVLKVKWFLAYYICFCGL